MLVVGLALETTGLGLETPGFGLETPGLGLETPGLDLRFQALDFRLQALALILLLLLLLNEVFYSGIMSKRLLGHLTKRVKDELCNKEVKQNVCRVMRTIDYSNYE